MLPSNAICLTGGIATGKTRVAEWLRRKRWAVIDTDQIVHELYAPGQDLPPLIEKEFGKEARGADGSVDRKALGRIVFENPQALEKLNKIVHPRVRERWMSLAIVASSQSSRVIVVIPLAYETNAQREFAATWVVACSGAHQRSRLKKRGFNDREVEHRISSQWPLQQKIDLADRVIWNDHAWNLVEQQMTLLVD